MIARVLASLSLSIVIALTGRASADKFSHKPDARPTVTLTERSRPIERRDQPAAPLRADDALRIEGLLGEIHLEQADLLRELIRTTPDSERDDRAEYHYRLAEIYAKQHRFHRLAGIGDELALARTGDAARRAALTASMTEHRDQARAALREAVTVYKEFTDDPAFVDYARMDAALFHFGYTLASAGRSDAARAVYDKLLKSYPGSRFVPDAHLAFAEAYWEARQLADAEARYRLVLRSPASSVYWYAMYKLGWVELNLDKPQAALELFYQVAAGTRRDAEQQLLFRSARRDFVRAYAAIGRADRALPAFRRVDDAAAYDMLAALGEHYLDQGKAARAIAVFRQLIGEQPTSPQVCSWQHAIARAMLTAGDADDRIREIEDLVRLWTALRSRDALPRAEAADCRDAAAEMSGQLARAYHQEAVKTQNPQLVGRARRLYRAYLAAFRDAADYGDTLYFSAELAWAAAEMERGPARLAAQRWEDVARAFDDALASNRLEPARIQIAADAAMLAWMKALDVDPRVAEQPIDDAAYASVPAPRPIPAQHQRLLAAYDGYLRHVRDPDDSERIDVAFHKANLLRRHDHLEAALPLFEDIVANHPGHQTAEWAAQLVLDSLNRLHRHDDMLAYAAALAPAFVAGKPGLKTVVDRLRRQAVRAAGHRLEAEARRTRVLATYVACGMKFIDAYNLDPLAGDAAELLWNSGVCFEAGRSIGAAKLSYELLQKLFPASKLAARSLARLGHAYGSIAFYREAAEKLEAYAYRYAGEDDAYGALSDAVQFRKGIGDDARAIDDARRFVQLFGASQPARAAAAYYSIADIHDKRGELDQLARHLRAYLERFGERGGADRRIAAYARLGDALWRSACPVPTVDGACLRVVRSAAWISRGDGARGGGVPRRCGDETRSELTVVARDPRKLRAASAAFAGAIAAYERATAGGARIAGDARGALYYYALARFTRNERAYERYLANPIPAGLEFDPRRPAIAQRSRERFERWFADKSGLATTLRVEYEAIARLGDGALAIAASARIGGLAQNFSAQLFRAEIPAAQRTGPYAADTAEAYCDGLTRVAEPLEATAIDAYRGCLVTSTRLGWFSEWSRICERELGQLQPDRWPGSNELRGAPDGFAQIVDVEPAAGGASGAAP